MDRDTAVIAHDEAAAAAWKRNRAYRDGFYILQHVVTLQTVVMVALAFCLLFYVFTVQRQDRFTAETANGRTMRLIGLDYPNMGRVAIERWVSSAVTEVMTFGFNDIDRRFTLSQRNFTESGWKNFYKAMVDSELVDSVLQNQQVVTSVLAAPPTLVQEGLIDGKYSWVFEVQILVTFRSGGSAQTVAKTTRVIVSNVSTRDNPSAIGIDEWYLY